MDINEKHIITKLIDELSKKAVDELHYEKTMQFIAMFEDYINYLTWDEECEIQSSEINVKQLLKMTDVMLVDDEDKLSDSLLRYVETVRRFKGERLFIFLNFRGFIDEKDFMLLGDALLEREFKVLFIDNKEYVKVQGENRRIIDVDLCEF